MKKDFVIFFLIILLILPLASASIFDIFTGKVIENGDLTEQVKCIFADSSEMQKCYTNDYKFSCSGIGSCIADVSGVSGTQLIWKSSCGMEFSTTIDGTNEELKFFCPIPVASTGGGSSSTTVQDSCTKDYICPDGTKIRQCELTSDGLCGCKAVTCPSITSTPTSSTATQIITSSEEIKEQVKCVFTNTGEMQKCYSEDGKFGCAGIGTCIADVYGIKGKQLAWKSTCGGYAYTAIDGNDEYAEFKCEQTTQIPTATQTTVEAPVEYVKEQVKCLFLNSDSMQKCYSEQGACSGIGSCVADVYGAKGKKLEWKSECQSYAYTITDGNNEYAEFKCEPTITPTQTSIVQPTPYSTTVKKAVMYIFVKDDSASNAEKKFIEDLQKEYPSQIDVKYLDVDEASKQGTQTYTIIVATYMKKGIPVTFLNNKVWNGFNDDIAKEIESEVKLCVEKGCTPQPQPPIPDELKIYVSSYMTAAPKISTLQAPVNEGNAKEQIRCIFKNSDVLLNPHTARPEKCLTEDGQYGCVWDGNVEVKENGERKAYCVIMNVEGQKGAKLTWKSSCGGYGYNVIDGNNEDVEFSCIPATNVTTEQIGGKGFMNAYWQCYDGKEFKSNAGNCKSSEVWQKEAQEFCKNDCKKIDMAHPHKKCPLGLSRDAPVGKAVVNGTEYVFELLGASDTEAKIKIINAEGITKNVVLAADSGVTGVSEKVFDLTIMINSRHDNADITVEGGEDYIDCMKCGINSFSVSDECYLEAGKEGVVFMPTVEEAPVPMTIKEAKAVEINKTEEINLICKDSCPFNNKCYPFGYRKADRFCSDNNAFISQLKSAEKCDNSFECKSNVCIAGNCISENLVQKVMNWFKKLFKATEKEETEESIDCGTSMDCMENVFKECKPSKSSQGQAVYEISGLKDEKCVIKVTVDDKFMTCKYENYMLGPKILGDNPEINCKGDLVKWLTEKTISKEAINKRMEEPTQTRALRPVETQIPAEPACEKIKGSNLKYLCNAMIKKDPSDCEMLDESAAPYCYADVALATGNSAICGKIKDSSHKEACEALVEKDKDKCSGWIYADYCYRDVAALTGNTAGCDSIKYEGGKIDCKAVVLNDASLCENSDNQDCYQKVALLTGDEKACDELKKRENEEVGSHRVIYNLDEEVSKCIKMAKKEVDGCLFELDGIGCDLIPAMAKDASLCDKLPALYQGDVSSKDRCYYYAAMSINDLLPPQLIVLRN